MASRREFVPLSDMSQATKAALDEKRFDWPNPNRCARTSQHQLR